MPELPEVETSVRMLKQKVLKKTFVCIWAEDSLKGKPLKSLKGKKIEDVERIGKGMFFHLSDGKFLFTHLKMTGHFLYGEWSLKECPLTKEKAWESQEKIMQDKKNGYLRFVFLFDNNKQLALSDPRKFAVVRLMSKKEKEDYAKKMGPDALEISKEDFVSLVRSKKKPIKVLLMEQNLIAGVGNIYASEILFKAGVTPKRKGDRISVKKAEQIYQVMRDVLQKGVDLKGDSVSDYRLLDGTKGGYQDCHLVYGRKGEKCLTCSKDIRWCSIGGRGTYYCISCQK